MRQTNGAYIAVEDDTILAAMAPMAKLGAVFAEPAGATALAGLIRAREDGLIADDETVVVINTGNGLKDVPAAIQVTGCTTVIEPTLGAVTGLERAVDPRRDRSKTCPYKIDTPYHVA